MKQLKWINLFLMLMCFATFALAQGNDKSKGKGKKVGNQEIVIKTSAQCDMCKERIEKALGLEKGIKSAVLDVDSKNLKVVFNATKTTAQKIREAVAKVGYDADEVLASKDAYKALPACCKKDGGH